MIKEKIIKVIAQTRANNGQFKQAYKSKDIINKFLIIIVLFLSLLAFTYGYVKDDIIILFIFGIIILGMSFLYAVLPYYQNERFFRLEFQYDNSLEEFKLIYRDKEIKLSYRIDREGRIVFAKDLKKEKNLCYADGTKLEFIPRLKVVNYFDKWLKDNDLLSSEV